MRTKVAGVPQGRGFMKLKSSKGQTDIKKKRMRYKLKERARSQSKWFGEK
jgi:hypothetical protein